jgi:hypothetical protein
MGNEVIDTQFISHCNYNHGADMITQTALISTEMEVAIESIYEFTILTTFCSATDLIKLMPSLNHILHVKEKCSNQHI